MPGPPAPNQKVVPIMVASFEYIDQIIATFKAAAAANRATPSRKGNMIVLLQGQAEEVMVAGDIHGHRRNFNAIRRIAALDKHPGRHLVLQEVCHGGPVYPENGGCMSHTILEDVAKLKTQFPERVHFILGNHELAELTEYPIQKNKQLLNLLFRLGLQQAYGPAAGKVREAFSEFLVTCPLGVRVGESTLVCHSIPENTDTRRFDASVFTRRVEPGEFSERGAIFRLVWGRDYRPENAEAFAELAGADVLINGHEPCPAGFATPNSRQVILDCSGEKAGYVILPVGPRLSQADVVSRIALLP